MLSREKIGIRFGSAEGLLRVFWGSAEFVEVDSDFVAHSDRVEQLEGEILAFLRIYHDQNGTQWGPSDEQLKDQLGSGMADRLVAFVIRRLLEAKSLSVTQGLVHLAEFRAGGALTDADRAIVDEIEAAFREGGLQPPGVVDVLRNDKERMRLYRYLVEKKTLYATGVANKPKTLNNMIVFHADTLERAVADLKKGIAEGEAFGPSDAKAYIETSRKYLIPLLECMDRLGVTWRKGNERFLAG
jgi:selenocysteine-specific elongation factor